MPRGAWILVIFVLSLVMSVNAASVRIGNFYYNAPNGIAFIKDDAAAFVIDPGGSYNAGVVAPDDSYHQVFLSQGDNYLIDFQWSRVGDAVVARLESQRAEKLVFKLDKNWPDFKTTFSSAPDGVTAVANTAAGDIAWKLQSKPAPDSSNATSITFALAGPGKPTYSSPVLANSRTSIASMRSWAMRVRSTSSIGRGQMGLAAISSARSPTT